MGATPSFTHHIWTGIISPGLTAFGYSRRRRAKRYPIFLSKSSNWPFHSGGIGEDFILSELMCQRNASPRMYETSKPCFFQLDGVPQDSIETGLCCHTF